MKLLITCGPAHEPIDQARRISNFSTGRLGTALCNAFAAQGAQVHCFRGEGATCPETPQAQHLDTFTTNEDLAERLQALSRTQSFDAVFHAAALCDFRVERVLDASGRPIASRKFSTRQGNIRLELAPAIKVLPRLREWFPSAFIVGWKYELEGAQKTAFERAWTQIRECRSDACVLNGSAYGPGFALCRADAFTHCPDAAALAGALAAALAAARH
jgi:phosphopantothenoylcysteine synthetase/decarboxylase